MTTTNTLPTLDRLGVIIPDDLDPKSIATEWLHLFCSAVEQKNVAAVADLFAEEHGESAALPLPLLQIAAVTMGLPQHRFDLCRWTAAPFSYCRCATAAVPQPVCRRL
jgi:hypothetical protein